MKQILFYVLSLGLFAGATMSTADAQQAADEWKLPPTERLYVHHDRTAYYAGEDIRMALYQTLSADTTASRVAYVDLLADNQNVVAQGMFPLDGGRGEASLTVPDDLPTGHYQLRAYTQWMRNFSPDGFFRRELTIYGATEPVAGSSRPEVRFYPEGGDWTEGLPVRIAFEVTGIDEPDSRRVFLIDDRGDTVRVSSPSLHGKGIFTFLGRAGATYEAALEGDVRRFPFPDGRKQGFALTVRPGGTERLRVQVTHNLPAEETALHSYSLLLHQDGKLIVRTAVDVVRPQQLLSFPIAELPAGVFTLSLVDEAYRAYAERLVFVRYPDLVRLTATAREEACGKGRKVVVHLQSADASGRPVGGQFSLAAVRADLCANGRRPRLASYLFLSSELRGEVAQMNDYWDPSRPDATERIELLLLTQGWRRYAPADAVRPDASALRFPIEQGLTLEGKVNVLTDKQARGLTLQAVWRQDTLTQVLLQDLTGRRFSLPLFPFTGWADVMLTARGQGEKAHAVTVDSLPAAPAGHYVPSPWTPESVSPTTDWRLARPTPSGDLESRLFDLGELTVTARRRKPADSRRGYGDGFVMNQMEVNPDQASGTVIDLLRRMPGVGVGVRGGRAYASLLQMGSRAEAALVLDGYPVRDAESVYSLDASRIERIEVLRGGVTMFGGMSSANGVIAFYTRPGAGIVSEGQTVCRRIGYTQLKEFYLPSSPADAFFSCPVVRHTYYWNASVCTDSVTGEAEVSFLLGSDERGALLFYGEGISSEGGAGECLLPLE